MVGLRADLENLLDETVKAIEFRDAHLESYTDRVKAYHGPFFNNRSEDYDPENHYFEYASLGVPLMVFDNPRVNVRTRRPGSQRDVAEALRHGLNRWIRDTNVISVLDAIAYDYLMCWGVLLTAQEPIAGAKPTEAIEMDKGGQPTKGRKVSPHWPRTYRISPRRFFMDPLALHWTEARYMGHDWVMDKDALLEEARRNPDAGWNTDVIRGLAENAGIDQVRDPNDTYRRDAPDRHEIVGRTIWIPEHQEDEKKGPDEGFYGTLYTIGVAQTRTYESDFIRAPRPFYGSPTGPYTLFGSYTVPDSPYPLSPLVATQGQVDDLNDHVRAANRNADAYKRLILVDAAMPEEMQKIAEAKDRYVIPVTGIDRSKAVDLEVGGITQQHLVHIETKRERLDRTSGIHEAQRGVVTGRGTATEVAEASQSSETRMGYVQRQYQNAVADMLKCVAWYMYHDDRVIFPMGSEAEEAMGGDPWYYGGSHIEGSGATFSDLELEIEPHSMQRANEGLVLKRNMEAFGVVVQSAPLMPQTASYIDWAGFLNDIGDALNIPNLGQRVNMRAAAELGGQQLAAADEKENQPRLAKDTGAAGALLPFKKPAASRELAGGVRGANAASAFGGGA